MASSKWCQGQIDNFLQVKYLYNKDADFMICILFEWFKKKCRFQRWNNISGRTHPEMFCHPFKHTCKMVLCFTHSTWSLLSDFFY